MKISQLIVGNSMGPKVVTSATVRVLNVFEDFDDVVATARTLGGLAVIEPILRHVTLAVCCNGSLGYEPGPRRRIWRKTLHPDAVGAIISALVEHLPDAGFGAYDGSRWVLSANYFQARGRWPSGPYRLATPEQIGRVDACALGICHPHLTSAQVATTFVASRVDSRQATFACGASDVLDVTPPGIDKATGVARALALLDIPSRRTIGFGDALNDLPMFGVLGHSVAVANAHERVLAAADTVASSVDHDGFATTLHALGITGNAQSRA